VRLKLQCIGFFIHRFAPEVVNGAVVLFREADAIRQPSNDDAPDRDIGQLRDGEGGHPLLASTSLHR
jgi:hypothetical protein